MIMFVNDDMDSDDDKEEGDSKVMTTAMIRHDYNNGRNNNNDIQIMFTMFNLVPSVFHLPSPKGAREIKISWKQGYTMTVWFTELVGWGS